MILAIRIRGMVDIPRNIQQALYSLRLRRKYTAVLINPTTENEKLLKQVRNYIAYGTINRETLIRLLTKRAQPSLKNTKIDPEKIIEQLEKKKPTELGIKPFFRLHPPRGGIESKKHAGKGKGVLGNNGEKINLLVGRML